MWKYTGRKRPEFAIVPDNGQESVWDYPRPPALAPDSRSVEVYKGKMRIAATERAIRVLETASPPTFYIPREDVDSGCLSAGRGLSWCEWKGQATYWDLVQGSRVAGVGWSYEQPTPPFAELAGYLSFYPAKVDCFVDGEQVRPQGGGFYGGWVTSEIVGPWKGEGGSAGW